ncbi:unnamed protein product [Adineta steineri]|uniref:NACHT domain-containing protein n=1 Tax=Adineta steineri TaxID=433720 RepID=A0A813ZW97_9BILA|nr:unnamed protein product [Adineta steineri]CAF3993095.1 unnamed protein product [Adineta steineri]
MNNINTHLLSQFFYQLSDDHVVVLALDGFDEINTIAQEKTIKLIQLLKTIPTIRIIIITREHSAYKLKDTFLAIIYELESLTKEQQLNYLSICWNEPSNTNSSRVELFVNQLEIINEKVENLLSTPLLCRVIAEAYMSETQINSVGADLSIMDLYAKFIEKKCEIYHRERLQLTESNPYDSYISEYFIRIHQHAALYLLQPEIYKTWYESEDPVSNKKKEILLNGGLIQSENDLDNFDFIHRTFAEYFEATLYISILSNERDGDSLLKNCMQYLQYALLCKQYNVVYMFIDSYAKKINRSSGIREYRLFYKRWILVNQSWIFKLQDDNSQTIQFKASMFNGRYTINENDQQQDLFLESSDDFIINLETLTIERISYLCTQLFRISTLKRQNFIKSLRNTVGCNHSYSPQILSEIESWISIYDFVHKNVCFSNEINLNGLFVKYRWLFQTVFPRLFSCNKVSDNQSSNKDLMINSIYKQRVITCMADLLISKEKDIDNKLLPLIDELNDMTSEVKDLFWCNTDDYWNRITDAQREEIFECRNVSEVLDIFEENGALNGFSEQKRGEMRWKVVKRDQFALEVDELLKQRKKDQKNFIDLVFSVAVDRTEPYELDEYLSLIESRIVEAIESKVQNGTIQCDEKYEYLYYSDYKMHLYWPIEIFEIFTNSIRLLIDPQIDVAVTDNIANILLLAIEKNWLEQRIPYKIDIETALDFTKSYFEFYNGCDIGWSRFYKPLVILLQRLFDEIYQCDAKTQDLLEIINQSLDVFAANAKCAVVADLYETKLILYKPTDMNGFIAEIIINDKEVFDQIVKKRRIE